MVETSQFLGRKLTSPEGAVEYRSRDTGKRYIIAPSGEGFLLSIADTIFRRWVPNRRQAMNDIEFLDIFR